MNIQHELIKDKFRGITRNGEISLVLLDRLSELTDMPHTEVEGFDYYEIYGGRISFYFIADFTDEDSRWKWEKSMWVVLEYDGNYKNPNVERRWSE